MARSVMLKRRWLLRVGLDSGLVAGISLLVLQYLIDCCVLIDVQRWGSRVVYTVVS